MYLDFAPMEGITGSAFRRLHHQYFPGVDRYYAPFLSPTQEHLFTPRELREILPEHNEGICLIPQILTRVPEDFLWMAEQLHAMGYKEVNLNVGCPSGTVTAKGKGCGMLTDPQALDKFLQTVFDRAPCAVSVKTRLGMEDPAEFEQVLEIYNKYPLSELIIHPRVRQDFYRHPVRGEYFERALQRSKNPVSYNGGLVTAEDVQNCALRYPDVKAIMLGQSLVSDPFLAGRLRHNAVSSKETLRAFHDELLMAYAQQFESRNNAVRRMKELWNYLIRLFDDEKKLSKKLMKSKTAEEYTAAVGEIFARLPLRESSAGGW